MASSTKLLLLSLLSLLHLLPFSAAQTTTAVNGGYWFPESGFAASSINSSLFTHLFCAFAELNNSTYQVTIPPANAAVFSQFTATVRLKNPNVQTLLSIGGGSANQTDFAAMASQSSRRSSFISSSINVARSNGFSGLDLDWEYPQTATEMTNLGTLLAEWRSAIAADAQTRGTAALLLAAAFYYHPALPIWTQNIVINYPVQSINANLDWVNAMAYDFYDPSWYGFTNAHAMLYDPASTVSGSAGVEGWIAAGLSAKKLALGVPFYGYAWRLASATNRGIGAPATGAAGGAMTYKDIRDFIALHSAPVTYNATLVTNYCSWNTTWIGYDDTQSIATKVTYAKQRGLLGYFAWQVGGDSSTWALSKQGNSTLSLSLSLSFEFCIVSVLNYLLIMQLSSHGEYKKLDEVMES